MLDESFDAAFGFKETEVLKGRKQQVFWEGNDGHVRVPPLIPVAIIAIDDSLKLLDRVRKMLPRKWRTQKEAMAS